MNTTQNTRQDAGANIHDPAALRPLSTEEIALIAAAGVSVEDFPVIPR